MIRAVSHTLAAALVAAGVSTGSVALAETYSVGAPQGIDLSAIVPREKPHAEFFKWRDGFRAEAIAAGIRPAVFDQAFAGVVPNTRVLELDAFQPEFVRPVWEYLDGAVSDKRVSDGRALKETHAALLADLEAKYGVQGQYLLAIWGLETSYGRVMGGHDVIRSMATLAYDGRRRDFFKAQLLAALRIMQEGAGGPGRLTGSWAGAMGHTQFMPTTFLDHAVDQDRDGRRNVWASIADALGSAAQYLQASGWTPGQRWGREVALPQGFDYALAGRSTKKSLAEWAALGVRLPGGGALPVADFDASVVVPAGHRGPAFLVYGNFTSILRYNASTSYAIAVGHLADRIAGLGRFESGWPREERPLSRSEAEELQRLLTAQGFDVGEIDGVLGAQTRAAVRDYQRKAGLPADGFATASLLARLRSDGDDERRVN
jgi:membrane-bound lytic murein transglycosylase B